MTHPNNQNEELTKAERAELEMYRRQHTTALEDYHEFGKAPVGSPERMAAYISQLSPHNLKRGAEALAEWRDSPKPTQAEDGELDEILNQLSGESFDAAINNPDDYMLVVNKSVAEAKQQILSLKSTWQAEARREMLERLPEKRIVANPDEHELGWSRHEAEHFNETIDLMRERLEQ